MHKSVQILHEKALSSIRDYLRSESELITILQEMDQCRGYREFGARSLFEYATKVLGLSESVTLNLTSVARKAIEVPALKQMIAEKKMTISNARSIVPILTPENQDRWLKSASQLSKRELEREIAKDFPRQAIQESLKPVSAERYELKLGISAQLQAQLKQSQDLIASKRKKAVNLEETLEVLVHAYLEQEDPMKRAERMESQKQKREARKEGSRTVRLKDEASQALKSPASLDNPTSPDILASSNDEIPSKPNGATQLNAATPLKSKKYAVKSDPSSDREHLNQKLIPRKESVPAHGGRDPRFLSAALKRQLDLRDGRQCTDKGLDGKRCPERKWIDYHHITPVSQGGVTSLGNLTTLCRGHHQLRHANPWPSSTMPYKV